MRPKREIQIRWREDRGKFQVDALLPPGSAKPRIRKLFDTKDEALAYATNELQPKLSAMEPVKDDTLTLQQAFERFHEATARRAKSTRKENARLAAHLLEAFGPTTLLKSITASRIAAYKSSRLAYTSKLRTDDDGHPAKLGAATINRPLALLRHLLRMAATEWEVLPKVPVVKLEQEPQGRLRYLSDDEEVRLLDACGKSQNPALLDLVKIVLETGLRRGEVLGLTWDRVDLSRGVIMLERTKSGKRREIPMRDAVYAVLSAMPDKSGRVWPDSSVRKAFETAVKRAKLEDFHFHDLRHSFASKWMMRGGSLLGLSKILGHATLAMTTRYAHLSPDHLRGEMESTGEPQAPKLRVVRKAVNA